MPLTEHPLGDYNFPPGIAPYSCGVVSAPGSEIAHVTLHGPVPDLRDFGVIERHLASEGRPRAALCGIELRSPCPFGFEGFAEFNAGYARILEGWGLFVGGVKPPGESRGFEIGGNGRHDLWRPDPGVRPPEGAQAVADLGACLRASPDRGAEAPP